MTAEESGVFDVDRLRREFDASFALPYASQARSEAEYLLIRAGGKQYALAIAEIGGVLSDVAVTPLPSAAPGLLGIAGLRGELLPVFDLAALLGGDAKGEPLRWLAISRGEAPLGLAFAVLEGHLRRPRDALLASPEHSEGFFAGAVERDGFWAVIGLARLLSTLRKRTERK